MSGTSRLNSYLTPSLTLDAAVSAWRFTETVEWKYDQEPNGCTLSFHFSNKPILQGVFLVELGNIETYDVVLHGHLRFFKAVRSVRYALVSLPVASRAINKSSPGAGHFLIDFCA